MGAAILVGAALVNCGDARQEELTDFLLEHAPEVRVFKYSPAPGVAYAGGGPDWQSILGTGADLIAYGTVLWAAYKRFVVPRLESNDRQPHPPLLFVQIHREGQWIELLVDRRYTSEEEFVHDFERQATTLQDDGDGPDELELLWEMEHSPRRTELKPRRRHS